ncbi:orotidine-5'-phosphate decarboxylase [Saprospira grandis]|uniref:Orotate phosphoribosyltransferase n=2 Tax=Saprospira TaxID=1007 RepID=H6LB32_SAPGL|nr:orotidine-5'-phosphate decarboxylase [Saprospira grandis]AFC26997.1 orotidine 5'-phosphate decarboxylase [Saprospira grandis str. Lewin]
MQKKEALLLKLEELGVLQFGQFTLKSGLSSPFYLDFRRVVAYPQLLKEISEQLWELIKDLEFDHLCGVPYAALSLSSALSMMHNKPMIVKRKEVKKHGTKKMVEGVFEEGQKAVVIDDVISSGISMIETLEVIEAEGLEVDYVISIVDRMQGGVSTLEKQGYQALSVYTIAEILDILYRHDRIDEQMYNLTLAFVQNNQIGYEQLRLQRKAVPRLNYSTIKVNTQNGVTKRLIDIMEQKQTNLCCSADVGTKAKLLQLAQEVGPYIAVLKTHMDSIEDFDQELVIELQALAKRHNFLLFEDRKFADIGHIVQQQFKAAPYCIADWADLITVHVVAGASSVDALKQIALQKNVGLIVVAQMSTVDTLTSREYMKKALAIAQDQQEVVVGVVSQNKRPRDAGLLMFTPGIKLGGGSDNLGQQYNHPTEAFEKRGIDLMIVGRGIYQDEQPAQKAAEYRKVGWEAYLKRL